MSLYYITELEQAVRRIIEEVIEEDVLKHKQSYEERIESLEQSVTSLRIALQQKNIVYQSIPVEELIVEFCESTIKQGDVIDFHPSANSISMLKLIATEGRFYEPLTRRFYATFQEWKNTITIPGVIRKMKTSKDVEKEL